MLRVESKKVSNKIVSFDVQEIYMYLCVNIALEILNIYANKVVKAIVRYRDIYVISRLESTRTRQIVSVRTGITN